MIVQRFLKGINGITDAAAKEMLEVGGIYSNWWRNTGQISPNEVIDQLTEPRLLLHLSHYATVRDVTPFISTTAGSVVRDASGRRNRLFSADDIATQFATDSYRTDGWVFSGYLFTLGCKAVEQRAFSEEARELHIYSGFLPYQPQGEIVAKIHIPAVQLEEAWKLEAHHDPARHGPTPYPTRGVTLTNTLNYVDPAELLNLRDVL